MNENKKVNLIIVFLVVLALLLVIQNHSHKKEIESLESKLSNIQTELNDTLNGIYNLREHINASFKESRSYIEAYSVTYDGINEKEKTVNIHMSFRLKETSPDTEVNVLTFPVDAPDPDRNSFKAATDNGIDYTCDFSVPYLYDYNFDIYETGKDGYNRKLNAEQIAGYVKSDIEKRTIIRSSSLSRGGDGIDINFGLENKTFGQEEFRIKKVEPVLLSDGSTVPCFPAEQPALNMAI